MDGSTKALLDKFIDYISNEGRTQKHKIQFGKWSLHDNRLTLEVFVNNEEKKVYVDLREIKENPDNFHHLLGNILDQIKTV